MPLFIYFFLYSFHIGILCTYFLRSCYILSLNLILILSLLLLLTPYPKLTFRRSFFKASMSLT
ncbi:hypothetical protein [Orientia tsutsugamushi]|uniref:hypothetical protein n=1 Tax=Orientia tsutsugamushi TaxID=784 RepID=UPI0013A531A6|nr:hypothetical protein [Orientia tsutsugamushi]